MEAVGYCYTYEINNFVTVKWRYCECIDSMRCQTQRNSYDEVTYDVDHGTLSHQGTLPQNHLWLLRLLLHQPNHQWSRRLSQWLLQPSLHPPKWLAPSTESSVTPSTVVPSTRAIKTPSTIAPLTIIDHQWLAPSTEQSVTPLTTAPSTWHSDPSIEPSVPHLTSDPFDYRSILRVLAISYSLHNQWFLRLSLHPILRVLTIDKWIHKALDSLHRQNLDHEWHAPSTEWLILCYTSMHRTIAPSTASSTTLT